jgi:rsbT co-antagonist protein RsbR
MHPSSANTPSESALPQIVAKHEAELLRTWQEEQLSAPGVRRDRLKESDLRDQSRQFLSAFRSALQAGNLVDIQASGWADARDILSDLSRTRARMSFSPAETANFIFSFRMPLLAAVQREFPNDAIGMMREIQISSLLIDKLGLFTIEVYQKSREEVIQRQQQEMLELSTPVVRLFEGVLALPLIGTLDSARTQVVMENLLTRIVETGAAIAIIDITGVPTVDTLVAQHLLKTVAAARLMGADCIISGIRPQIAQTIVHLGVELGSVTTKATLADAFAIALQRSGMVVRKISASRESNSN